MWGVETAGKRYVMPRQKQDNKDGFATVIRSVTSVMGLSALAILSLGAAFTAVLYKTPENYQFPTFALLAGILISILVMNMIYYYVIEKLELTFRVRVATVQNNIETPCENQTVRVYKNKQTVTETSTDEMGISTFTVKLQRHDELYVVVIRNGIESNKAAVYSGGQCQMVKTIRI